jgi:DnaJ homolog subfamily B member 4
MKVNRSIVDAASGKTMQVAEILAIDIKPGWKSGTRVTFAGKGNESPGQPTGDVVFIIEEQKHARFVREGNDLVYMYRISLKDALCGGTVQIDHLDGTKVPVEFRDPLSPSSVIPVRYAFHTLSMSFTVTVWQDFCS